MAIYSKDLTQQPPRSPRIRIGGYVLLARMLDKGRAVINGKNGEFKFNCPLDQHFLNFVGISGEDLRKELEKGKSDAEILEWVQQNAKNKYQPHEIEAWSRYQEQRGPSDVEMREFFHKYHTQVAPHRKDIATWFELLDVDDYVTFGGKA